MTTLASQSQNLAINAAVVELFVLDATAIGGDIHRFTPNSISEGKPIYWQGNMYFALPVTTSGWEYNSDGSQKTPQLQISNASLALLQEIILLGDLVGAKLTRYRTMSNFLDGAADANPDEQWPPDEAIISQKIAQNKSSVTWQLVSPLAAQIKIPRRQVTKDGDSRYCSFPAVGAFRAIRN